MMGNRHLISYEHGIQSADYNSLYITVYNTTHDRGMPNFPVHAIHAMHQNRCSFPSRHKSLFANILSAPSSNRSHSLSSSLLSILSFPSSGYEAPLFENDFKLFCPAFDPNFHPRTERALPMRPPNRSARISQYPKDRKDVPNVDCPPPMLHYKRTRRILEFPYYISRETK